MLDAVVTSLSFLHTALLLPPTVSHLDIILSLPFALSFDLGKNRVGVWLFCGRSVRSFGPLETGHHQVVLHFPKHERPFALLWLCRSILWFLRTETWCMFRTDLEHYCLWYGRLWSSGERKNIFFSSPTWERREGNNT